MKALWLKPALLGVDDATALPVEGAIGELIERVADGPDPALGFSRSAAVLAACSLAATALSNRLSNGAMSSVDFSGFCGLTIHQTASSPSFCKACRLICRCPACAGLNDPPKSPTVRPAQSGPA